MRLIRDILTALLAAVAIAIGGAAIAQDAPRVVLFEDPDLSANRLHYPLLIDEGRGYRIRCATQANEEEVIRGLGFTTVPSTILSAVDPEIVAARPDENPLLCPTGPQFPIKVFAAEGGQGLMHYLQFPSDFGETTFADRLYVPGCAELVQALGIDLTTALSADPTPFFVGKIHEIACLSGTTLEVAPDSFSDWCMKGDRSPVETSTVMALLDSTPGGVSALGNAAACASAESFLRAISTLNLNGKGVQSLTPLSVLTHLTSLSLVSNDITDIAPLSKLTALSFLDLSNNRIGNITALATLTSLTKAVLSTNEITDIRALSALALLTSLNLDNNRIGDLSPLQFLQALSTLSLAGNELTGAMLEPLTALGALANLDLSGNQIADFEFLAAFPSTLDIDLTDNPIVTAEGQTFLDLCILHQDDATPYGQTIRTIVGLNGSGSCAASSDAIMATTTLDLSGKIISDIRPLAVLTHLTNLNLSANAIADISALSGLVGLIELNLAENNITDIRPIAPLLSLTSFDATGNPMELNDFLSACLMRHHADLLSHEQSIEVEALLSVSGEIKCKPAADDLSQLTTANIREFGLTSLNYFDILQNLKLIDLSGNGLNDVTGLQGLPGLTTIVARQNNIASLASFRPIRGLEDLILDENPLTSIVGISDLSKLRRVSLSNTGVRSILPLGDLPVLESAQMRNLPLSFDTFREYCLVNRFDPIALGSVRSFMTALEKRLVADHVDLNDCGAIEAWVASQTVLTLNKQAIVAVDPIVFFTELRELHLFDNLIMDPTPVASLRLLEKLNLATNRIRTLPRFASTALKAIYVNDNDITDLQPLNNLGALASFDGRNNRIENVRPLLSNTSLGSIDVRGNRIGSLAAIDQSQLPKTYLGDNPICQLLIFNQALIDACKRQSFLVVGPIVDFGDVLINPNIGRLNECTPNGLCPSIRIRPELLGPIVNP